MTIDELYQLVRRHNHDGVETEELDIPEPETFDVVTAADTATLTVDADATDMSVLTAQAQALTIANPTGTPTQGQKLIIRIKDNGTARAISYGTQYRALGNSLPSTTVISKTLYLGVIYNSTDTKWDLVAVAQET